MSTPAITVGVLPGDGIGPAITAATRRLIDACDRRLEFDLEYVEHPIGWQAQQEHGSPLPAEVLAALDECDCALLGPIYIGTHPEGDEIAFSASGRLRSHFDLFANIRPVKSYHPDSPLGEGVDLVTVRQNTEGFYADRNMEMGDGEFKVTEDTVLSLRVVTRKESRRIAEAAFDYASTHEQYEKVTAVHKANILKLGDGLFLEECARVAEQYEAIELDEFHVDAFAMELIRNPREIDVIVTTNMFGDILSDEAAGLVGGLGLAPGINIGEEYAIAQPTHGAAPDIAGQAIANPTAMMLSAKLLLEWLGEQYEADSFLRGATGIESAVARTLTEGRHLTPDLGGSASTAEFTDTVIDNFQATL